MFDATSPSDPPARLTVAGRAELAWTAKDGETRLGRHFNTDPLRFLFPRTETDQPSTAVLVTTSGGLVGGDVLDISIAAQARASAMVMTQAAEKVYRSAGPTTRIDVALDVAAGSRLEWLPHETILFDGARLRRRTCLDLIGNAEALAGEIITFGRTASGEAMTHGLIRDAWEVRRDGRLIWADAFETDDNWGETLSAPAGLGGAISMATIVCACADPDMARDAVRARLTALDTVRGAATVIHGLILVRFLAADTRAIRQAFGAAWAALRHTTTSYSEALPRLWHI